MNCLGRKGANKCLSSGLLSALLLLAVLLLQLPVTLAADASANEPAAPVTTEALAALKKEAIALNRDLFILEEDLLFPSSTQVAVFVSVDVGRYFQLDSVKLSIDGQVLNHYLYTERDWDALKRGGIQRLYVGNLSAGPHELVALFTGRAGAGRRESTRASSLQFDKETGPKYVELKIVDDAAKQQANFDVRAW